MKTRVWWEVWVRALRGDRRWMPLGYRAEVFTMRDSTLPEHAAPTSSDAHAFAKRQMRAPGCIKVVKVTRRTK